MRASLGAALACLLAVPGVAAAEEPPDDSARDEAIFGPAEEAEEDAPAGPEEREQAPEGTQTRDERIFGPEDGDRDRDVFGPATPSTRLGDRLGDRIDEAYDKLAIGGRLFLRLDYAAFEEVAAEDALLSSPSFLDVYLDARPNDRVRAFVQGRLRYDFTVGGDSEGDDGASGTFGAPAERTETSLDQLWIKFDIARRVFVTFGRQPVRWGPGRFWNPTDFLNRRFKEPLEVLDERLGLDLLKLHIPIESLGWNLYAIADLSGAGSPEEVGGALRAEVLLGTTEIAATAAAKRDQPVELGLSLSSSLWLFDVKAEVAVLHDLQRPRWEGDFDFETGTVPDPVDQEGDWLPRAVVGAEIGLGYGDGDAVYLGAEYFYNGLGYDSADLYPWLAFQGDFVPLYTGRHYAGLYGFLPSPGSWEDTSFIVSTLGNLSDRSFVTRFDYRVRVLTWLDVSAWATVHYGDNGELNLGVTVPAIEGIPELEQGLDIPQPLVNLGVGLIVAL